MMTLAAVLCCALAFNACTKNDPTEPEAPDTTPVAAKMSYSFTLGSDDMVNMLDVTIDYYDADGTVKSEAMTGKTWSKTVQSTGLPAKLGARMRVAVKAEANLTAKETFVVSSGYEYVGSAVNKKGENVGETFGTGSTSTMTIKSSQVAEWAERHKDGLRKYLHSIAADGSHTSISWE